MALSAAVFLSIAQPGFGQWIRGVANSASYDTRIAPGSIFVVFGDGLGPYEKVVQASSYPLPGELAGISVEVEAGGKRVLCPIIYVFNYQLAAILPSSVPVGTALMRVHSPNNWQGNAYEFEVAKSAFGIYTTRATGSGPGSITSADYRLNTFATTVRPGDIAVIWGTGLGAAPGDDGAGPQPGVEFQGINVYIGNRKAKVLYAGRSGSAALDQINIEVPDMPDTCFAPVAVESDAIVSNFVTMSIDHAGGNCATESGMPTDLLHRASRGEAVKTGMIAIGPDPILQATGFPVAAAAAERVGRLLGVEIRPSDAVEIAKALRLHDRAATARALRKYGIDGRRIGFATLRKIRAELRMDQFSASAVFGMLDRLENDATQIGAYLPASGTCTVIKSAPIGFGSRSRALDAGPSLALTGPLGPRTVGRLQAGAYEVSLGSGFTGSVLPSGTYNVAGAGGSQVDGFDASVVIRDPLAWSNKSSIDIVDRNRPLTVEWSGGSMTGYVLVGGSARAGGPGTAFVCVEEARKGQFTIPAHVLASLPASATEETFLFVAQHPLDNRVAIPGLDLAYFWNAAGDYRNLTFR